MNNTDRLELRSFESDVRQLLKAYRGLKSDIMDLRRELNVKDAEIERLESELRAEKRAYSTLKMARMLELSDSDVKESKLRITRLVREVNKCIRLLSAETVEDKEDVVVANDLEVRERKDDKKDTESRTVKDNRVLIEDEANNDKEDDTIDIQTDNTGMRSLFGDEL